MAKTTSKLVHVNGTFNGVTYVNSSAYAPHIRRPRGSVKPAVLNETLANRAAQTAAVNHLAKNIYDVIIDVAGLFRERNLWRRLLSKLQRTAFLPVSEQLANLRGLEINNRYPLRVSFSQPVIHLEDGQVTVTISFYGHPHFPYTLQLDCYYYRLHLLWLDATGKQVENDGITTDWVSYTEEKPSFAFLFPKPSKALHLIVFLLVQGGEGKKEVDQLAAKGMSMVYTYPFS
jgi:hypothetical protein